MSQIPILVPASKLTKSPTNVRKSTDPVADAQLEANIAEKGIIQNLIGVPVSRKKGHYRVTAGGRRLDAVHRLIEKAMFDGDYLVPVLPLADAKDAIEISLAENFFRLAMNPAEACRAFQDVIETEGKTPADVAKRFGVTEKFVLGRLRLAGLAEPVFDALAANAITLDVAMAYASTSDTERQAAVYGQIGEGYYRSNVSEIRRQLAAYSYRASDPRALLVGRDAYAAEMYRAQSGWPWSPARGTRASSASSASQIAVQDFLRARQLETREKHSPQGPIVVFSGPALWHDWEPIWERLDAVKARVPHMTLVTTGQRKGADAIAAAWAARPENSVPLVVYGLYGNGRKTAFTRNRKLAELKPVEAILCEGSGLQANLYQVLRQAGVPIHAFRKADQAPDQSVRRIRA